MSTFRFAWDEAVFRWVNKHHYPGIDELMVALSDRWLGVAVLVIMGGFLVARLATAPQQRSTTIRTALSFGLALFLCDFIGAQLVKRVTQRARPCFVLSDVHTFWEQSNSGALPSLHAANAMAVFIVFLLSITRPRRAIAIAVVPVAIGYSRVYTGVHWPTDVLAGFAWGAVCALISISMVNAAARPVSGG